MGDTTTPKMFETLLTMRVMRPAPSLEVMRSEMETSGLQDIRALEYLGELLVSRRVVTVEEIPAGQVIHRLAEHGDQAARFLDHAFGSARPGEELGEDEVLPGDRIAKLREASGLTDGEVAGYLGEFLIEAGLASGFATWLEARMKAEEDEGMLVV